MNKRAYISVFIFLILFFQNCEPVQLVELPSQIELGDCNVYLNGEEANYPLTIRHDTLNELFNFSFVKIKDNGNLVNTLGFSFLPLEAGEYILHTEREIHKGALTSFSQTLEGDLPGYSYEIVDEEEGYFEILTLDENTISGRFKASFKRTSKNWNRGLELPKRLIFQGVFHKEYE